MSEREQNKPSGKPGRDLRCDQWEDLIADALDGTLSEVDAAAFARHQVECPLCAQMLKETNQGKAWMNYLAAEPEVPSDLLQKILARTTGLAVTGVAAPVRPAVTGAAWQRMVPRVGSIARQVLEPRLMMTVAMAFFSIALTLNLTGIKLTEIRAYDLQPSRMRANLTRQYYSTNEQVMKYYENLRLVYEMEARVRELRRSSEAEPAAAPASRPKEEPKQAPRDGTGSPSSKAPPGEAAPGGEATPGSQRPVPQGQRTHLKGDAVAPAEMVHMVPQRLYAPPEDREFPLQVPASFHPAARQGKLKKEVFRALRSMTEDQAERSLV